MESIKLTGRYQGAKNLKYKKYDNDILDTHDYHPDDDDGVYPGAIGKGTIIE